MCNDHNSSKYTILLIDDEQDQIDKIKKIIDDSDYLKKHIKSVETRLVDPQKGAGEVSKEIQDNPAHWNIILSDLFMPTPAKGGQLIADSLIRFFEDDTKFPVRLIFISNKKGASGTLRHYIPRFRWIDWYPKPQSSVPDGFNRDDLAENSVWSYAIAKAIVKLNEDAITEGVSTIEDLEVGLSGKMRIAKSEAEIIAKKATDTTTILIRGDSGTGKEVFANYIFRMSPFKGKPFVAVNCGNLDDRLLESELFGHKKGAFTGAYTNKIGKFDDAQGGVIFLDEVGELLLHAQSKLLRVLSNTRDYCPVGGKAELIKTFKGVIILATNKPIEKMNEEGFRKDLFYRIEENVIRLSPLKERKEDIIPLAKHLIKKVSEEREIELKSLSKEAEYLLEHYNWPGNVRELENVIGRAITFSDGEELTLSNFSNILKKVRPASALPEENLVDLPPDKFVLAIKKGTHTNTLISITGLDFDTLKEKVKAGLKILLKKAGTVDKLSDMLDIKREYYYGDYLSKWKLTSNDIKDPFPR